MQPLKIQKIDSSFVALQVEVADSDEERMKGLMFRKSLNENEGMLFVFDRDTDGPFWMKDTPLSLDIIFINSQNQVVSIAENTTPFSEQLIYSSSPPAPSLPYRFALEVRAGFTKQHQIQKGDIIIY